MTKPDTPPSPQLPRNRGRVCSENKHFRGSVRSPSISWLRFIPVMLLIGGTKIFLRGRTGPEALLTRHELSSFPMQLGNWEGIELPIESDVRNVLGPGDYIQRIYRQGGKPPVDLFLAYFPSQRQGDAVHSPRHCLPGSGWTPIQSSRTPLIKPDGQAITVNYYLVAKGLNRQVVLYWYQAHGRVEASEYSAKFYLIADAIRLNRTDGSLIRVMTAVAEGESADGGLARAKLFAPQVLPLLDEYIPR